MSTAYALKKSGRPFRIYEASARWGGRVLSLQSFGQRGASVDLGGEWLRSDQEQLLSLLKELRIRTKGQEKSQEFFLPQPGQRAQELPDLNVLERELRKFVSQNTRTQVDQTPFAELQEKIRKNVDSRSMEWLRSWTDFEWGAESEDLSSLQVLTQFINLPKPQQKQNARNHLRVEGGARVLVQALQDRLVGVIPQQFCRLEHRLTKVEQRSREFILTFLTPAGEEEVTCKQWVCALPLSQYRHVDGLVELLPEILQRTLPQIRMGKHSKVALETELTLPGGIRFWESSSESWHWEGLGDQEVKTGVDRLKTRLIQTRKFQELQGRWSELQKQFGFKESSHVNWSEVSFIGGSKTYLTPGSWSAFSEASAASQFPQWDGNWVLANEALSLRWMGTMAGAVESGLGAAQYLLNRIAGLDQGSLNSRFES